MVTLISFLIIIAAILLILVVFVQNPKGGGLSSDFGAAQQLGGVQRTSDFIEKATWTLAGVIGVLSLTLTFLMKKPRPQVPADNGKKTEDTRGGGSNQPGKR